MPRKLPVKNTDEMHLEKKNVNKPPGQNAPQETGLLAKNPAVVNGPKPVAPYDKILSKSSHI